MRELTPLVEPVSIDEAFLDLSGTERLTTPARPLALARFARRVEDEIGITVSVGLSYNKFLAKIASDLEKPRGFSIIGRREAADFLADKPVGIIPGIGAAAQARLAKVGVTLVRHLREARAGDLARILGRDASAAGASRAGARTRGPCGRNARRRASRPKPPSRRTCVRSRSCEPILWRLTEKVSGRLKALRLGGPQRDAEAEGFCVPAADPHPLRPAGDATGRPPVRSRPNSCCAKPATAPPSG